MSSEIKNLKDLNEKNIAVLGLGIENYALVKYLLKKKVNCDITICDDRPATEFLEKYNELDKRKNISWKLGEYAHEHLDGFDVLFRSPGWPIEEPGIQAALKMGVALTSSIKLFFYLCPTEKIIGVTGTKGKGTTASIIYAILKKANKRAWLGGNIGVAPFSFIEQVKKTDWIILELSSFQLEDMTASPRIAVMTNFAREHLSSADPDNPNCHKSMQAYWRAKANIFKWQRQGDWLIAQKRLAIRINKLKPRSKIIYFKKLYLESKLQGEHNKENIAAAAEVAGLAGIKQSVIKRSIAKFPGLEHRLEFVRRVKDIAYYNDSFATTPDSAITALKSFSQPLILLAGGAEKKSDFKRLVKIIKQRVKFIILFKGEATPRLQKLLRQKNFPKRNIKLVDSMREAVARAREAAQTGDIILLSPACASFGIFKNYKERGELFKQAVRKL